ncbi:MAG: hypothetical protein JXA66_06340 [Oligoflexia bacterium]|nr:hypothetical protein [Oligoflexia bacterium]
MGAIKFKRIITPLILGTIATVFAIYFIPEINLLPATDGQNIERGIASVPGIPASFYFKILGMFFISVALVLCSFYLRGHFSIPFVTGYYMLASAALVIGIMYYEMTNNLETFQTLTVLFGIVILAVFVFYELRLRKIIQRAANGCFNGKRLVNYGKAPWEFAEEITNNRMCVLYFDVPELARLTNCFEPRVLKKVIDFIYKKSDAIISRHNGIIIRRTDDSILLTFEPGEYYEEVISPDSDCAYHAVSCALELRRMIGDMKEFIHHNKVSQLRGRVLISTDNGMVLKHHRKGRIELSLFSEALYTINDLIAYSNGEDLIIDPKTFNLTSNYFVGKDINNQAAFSIIGLSGY